MTKPEIAINRANNLRGVNGFCFSKRKLNNPVANGSSRFNKFAYNLKVGTNIWVTKRIGIKLEANLLSAVRAASNGFYFKHDYVGIDASSYTTIFQPGLGGGLTYKIGK